MECLSLVVARPAPSPSCPSGRQQKFSGRREHGTPDHAVLPALGGGRPSVQLPAGIERRRRYSGIWREGKGSPPLRASPELSGMARLTLKKYLRPIWTY